MEVLLSIISFFLLIALIVKVNGIRDRLTEEGKIFREIQHALELEFIEIRKNLTELADKVSAQRPSPPVEELEKQPDIEAKESPFLPEEVVANDQLGESEEIPPWEEEPVATQATAMETFPKPTEIYSQEPVEPSRFELAAKEILEKSGTGSLWEKNTGQPMFPLNMRWPPTGCCASEW